MTGALMPCFERARRALAGVLVCAAALGGLATAPTAQAHKGSDAYLQLTLNATASALRVDVALRDLDAVLDIDANANGELTWGEIRSAWPAIERYLAARVQVDGCEWDTSARSLERRADGVYAALTWSGRCVSTAALPTIHYTALREVDPTHRAIAKIDRPGADALVQVLDPTKATPRSASGLLDPALTGNASPNSAPNALPADSAGTTAVTSPASVSIGPQATATVDVAETPAATPADTPAAGFVREGMRHILSGYDHVLFLLCLLLPAVMRRSGVGTAARWQPVERLGQAVLPVAMIVTAFTVAHSVTLTLAGLKLMTLPSSFIEPAIAATIIFAAIDNVWPIFRGRRALVTFAFGLIHGFGFAGVLGELNLPAAQFAWALFQFNLGIELGQLVIVAVAVSSLFLIRQNALYPRWIIQGGSALAIGVAAVWFIERTADVSIFGF
jgi:hypothetical protein